jgi:hypothetical protein
LTTILLLAPRKLPLALLPAGLPGFVVYDLRMGLGLGAAGERGAYWVAWRVFPFQKLWRFLTVPPAVLGSANGIRERRKKPAAHWLEAGVLMIRVVG